MIRIVLFVLLAFRVDAALLSSFNWTVPSLNFSMPFTPVTSEDTPEWAKLPGANQWCEMETLIGRDGAPALLHVLRVLQYFELGQTTFWADIYSLNGGALDPLSPTTEPSSLLLLGFGLLVVLITRRRRDRTRVAGDDADHRSSWST